MCGWMSVVHSALRSIVSCSQHLIYASCSLSLQPVVVGGIQWFFMGMTYVPMTPVADTIWCSATNDGDSQASSYVTWLDGIRQFDQFNESKSNHTCMRVRTNACMYACMGVHAKHNDCADKFEKYSHWKILVSSFNYNKVEFIAWEAVSILEDATTLRY